MLRPYPLIPECSTIMNINSTSGKNYYHNIRRFSNMNKERAKEIYNSPDEIGVTHEDKPVYIEKVSERSETARVHPLDQPNINQEVPLFELKETNS